MSEAISKLYVLLGLKSTLEEDGKKASASASKTALAIGASLTGVGVAAKLMADDINSSYLVFDDALAQVKSLGGVTDEQMSLIRANSLALSEEMPIAAEQVAAGYYAMRSAGYAANDAIAEMPAIARAAVAGNMEMADTVNAVTMVLDVYGGRAGNAEHITNILLGTVQNFKTTLPELQQQLSKSADAANTLGMDFGELNAASGLLRKNFLSAEEAGTGMKTFLLKLADANTQAYLESLGVSVSDASGNFVGLQSVLDQLDVALQESGGNVNQMALLNQAFGAEGVRVAMSLINQKDALGEYTKALEEGQAVDQAFAAQMGSTGAQLEISRNRMEAARIELGGAMAPATLAAADAMSYFAGIISDVPEPLQAIAGTSLIAGQSLIAIGPAIAGIVPAIEAYRTSTFAATVATEGFSAALLANPATLTAVAVAGVALTLGTYLLATRRAESATKDLNAVGNEAIAQRSVALKQAKLEEEALRRQIGTQAAYIAKIEANIAKAKALGEATEDMRSYLGSMNSELHNLQDTLTVTEGRVADLNAELDDLEQAEIDIEMAESQQTVDSLESGLSRILGLMDEISGKDRSAADLQDTEALQEIRVRTSQSDLDEAERALKEWQSGGDNAYALEFGAAEGKVHEQELIDAVTEAQVSYNRAVRDHEATLSDLNSLEDEYAAKQTDLLTIVADLNREYPDLALSLQDIAEGQEAVNQKIRDYIALTPAGIERDQYLAMLTGTEPPAEADTGFNYHHNDRGPYDPALLPLASPETIEVESDLNRIREIRNRLDGDAVLSSEDLQEIYQELRESDLPNLAVAHDLTVTEMIQVLDEYIRRQEVAIANMDALGGNMSASLPSTVDQPERAAAVGIPYVPRDMTVRVHRGETITPAAGSAGKNVTININNPVVREERDIDLITNQIYRRFQRA